MNEQEASEHLQRIQRIIEGDYPKTIALDMGIKALEKQMPKKPLCQQGNPIFGYCPACGKPVTPTGSPKVCKTCAQGLDWSKSQD